MALILASASDSVVQVTDVPGLFTSGSAAQTVDAAHLVITNFPPEHCAKPLSMQARSPSTRRRDNEMRRKATWDGTCIYRYKKN